MIIKLNEYLKTDPAARRFSEELNNSPALIPIGIVFVNNQTFYEKFKVKGRQREMIVGVYNPLGDSRDLCKYIPEDGEEAEWYSIDEVDWTDEYFELGRGERFYEVYRGDKE
jgi:hypothetical protein